VVILLVVARRFPSNFLAFAYSDFLSVRTLDDATTQFLRAESVKRFDGQVTIVTTRSNTEGVVINGYRSLFASRDGQPNQREVIVGVMPALFAKTRDNALVLGTGTGITAGATALMFDHVTAVEISPAVADSLPRFARYNFDLATRPNVHLVVQDGLSVIASAGQSYDAIVSTVTSPIYFSSHKLYTRDFFELVKRRLAPDGVFSFWFDSRLPRAGVDVLLQTMSESFQACDFVYLTRNYYEVICGQRLQPHFLPDGALPPAIRRLLSPLANGIGIERFLDALVLTSARYEASGFSDEVNTFDRPVLERIMARQPQAFSTEDWDLDRLLQFDLSRSAFGGPPFSGDALADRCQAFAAINLGMLLPRCEAMVHDSAAIGMRQRLATLAVDAASHGASSALPESEVVESLLAQGRAEDALSYLDLLRPRFDGVPHYELARLQVELTAHGRLDAQALSRLVANEPLDPTVRQIVVDEALREGREDLARLHLGVLARMRPLSDVERALAERLPAAPQGASP
jgi:spermidine synthase